MELTVFAQNSYVEALTHAVIVLGDGPFKDELGGTLMQQDWCLYKGKRH